MAEHEVGLRPLADALDALDTQLHVDIRWRGGRPEHPDVGQVDPEGVAREQGPRPRVDQADVMRGVPRRVHDLEPAVAQHDRVALVDRA